MTSRRSPIAVLAISALLLSACGQKTAKTEEPSATPAASAPAAEPTTPAKPERSAGSAPAPAPKGPASLTATPPAPSATVAPSSFADFVDEPALQDVFFDPGHADIGRNGAKIMRANAHWIVENPGYLILIEGHTDYKGTREGNVAMGERRAKAAERALVKDGVPAERLFTLSHGSEKPVCAEKTDVCAAKNRRVHFRVRKP
jgi:peptidoglycan-associated lipoprotein